MANRVFQSVIYQMKDAINRVVGVVDETGAVISCSELNLIGEVREGFMAERLTAGDRFVRDGYTYQQFSSAKHNDYAVFVEGVDETAGQFAAMLSISLQSIKQYHDEKFDKSNFIKNVVLDNILPGDIYAKARELHFATDVSRVVFIVRVTSGGDISAYDVVSSLFPDKQKDFVFNISETDTVLVKEIRKGIVYAGVGKRDKELKYAIEQNILAINCESIQELELVDALSAEAGKVTDIALRINPDIDPKTNHCIDTGQADSKFGISYEEVLEHAAEIRSLKNVNIIGLHLHIGSQIRELHVFENMCNKVNVIVENLEKLGCKFRFVDVGGGLGVNYDVPENEPIPNFASLFSIVHNHLRIGDREVHFEFGRSIVAECGELITTVLFNKTTATGRKLVIVDASMTELVRPAMYGSYHNIENITAKDDEVREKYTVVGTACESTDVFDENVTLRRTHRGDLLTIKSAGAYGMSMASRYNLHDLPGAVYSDEIK